MRIKKTTQTTTTQAQVVDGYSTSKIDGYSCNYVNNAIKDTYSETETKTNKIWTDGKPLYRKTLTRSGVGTFDISGLNASLVFLDLSHSIAHFTSSNRWIPIVETSYANLQNQVGAYINNDFTTITVEKGSGVTIGDVIVTIEYTKSS